MPREYIEIGYTLGAKPRQITRDIVLRAMAPSMVDNLRITLGWCWTWIIVAEIVAANSGIGHAIWSARRLVKTPEVMAAFAALDAAGEVPDIVVNCAGIIIERPLTRMTLEEFERIMRVNLRGCFLVGREAVIRMRDAGRGGRVINIASELAHLGRADYSAYCASKAAVIGLTRSWARELARDILVNAVAPGPRARFVQRHLWVQGRARGELSEGV